MNSELLFSIILSVISSGGLVAIIQFISNRKKNNADASDMLVKTAMEIEKLSTSRYISLSQELTEAKSLIDDIEKKLIIYKNYVETLKGLLKQNGIEVPPFREEVRE